MNLVLDIGNTRIKAATFSKNGLEEVAVYLNQNDFLKSLVPSRYNQCIVSSVLVDNSWLLPALEWKNPPLWMHPNITIPLRNDYLTPLTLGSDRLAAAVAANKLAPLQPVLSIDTGTCIKYNLVHQGSFIGGAISPGLAMRLKALNQFTSALPDVDVDLNYQKLVGQTTEESILSGALIGAIAEVDGIIEQYMIEYPGLTVVMSGGDTDFFVKRLKNSTFARPHFVLEGLNTILEYHVNQK